jgi:hypothetical protein
LGATADGIRNPSSDTSHSRGRLMCSQNPGIGNGGIWAGCLGKPRKTCSSTVFGNRCSGLTPREGFRNECARQRCDGLKDAVCATRVVFKGTGTIWLRCHRSRRQDREAADAPPDRTRTAPRNQPGMAGPAHVALRTFEQTNPCSDDLLLESRHQAPEMLDLDANRSADPIILSRDRVRSMGPPVISCRP